LRRDPVPGRSQEKCLRIRWRNGLPGAQHVHLEPRSPGRLGEMGDVLARVLRFFSTADGKKMLRYTTVSVISTVLSFTVLGIVFGVLRLWTEVPSTIFTSLVLVIPNYYLNRGWVWGKSGRSHWRREVLPFWAISVSATLLSIGSAAVARHISVANHVSHAAATVILLSVTIFAFGIVWGLKFMIFNRMFRVALPEAVGGTNDSDPQRAA
jgi:putative flippase GtrA